MAKKERSRSYPSASLEKAIEDTKLVKSKLGSGKLDRDQISIALGYQRINGLAGTRISTMVQFGLLDKDDGYSLSKLSEKITHPKSKEERNEAILEAFLKPELYAELVQRYQGDGRFPDQLDNILYRDFGITANASQDAAKLFIQSAQFANLIDEARVFLHNETIEIHQNEEEIDQTVYIPTPNKYQQPDIVDMIAVTNSGTYINNYSMDSKQTFNFSLSEGKFAQVIVPTGLKTRDIQILRKQIELLELQIEGE
ncbi:hypothetical protein [Cohnella caldifontis]|uniref:hypothetical protein n=1 Tax=Cohnella caldifontis TaxID=3027471 RepID=UPI0023EBD5CD|nr:hypothetical protein [Cohnella sp. YIM B05605]